MLYRPPLQSACYFCSVLALLALLNLSCVYLLSRAPGVVELEEGKKKVYSGRIEPNMRIPARHVHAAPEYKQRKWMWGRSHVQEMLRVTLRFERAAEEPNTQRVWGVKTITHLVERMGEVFWEEMTEKQRNLNTDGWQRAETSSNKGSGGIVGYVERKQTVVVDLEHSNRQIG